MADPARGIITYSTHEFKARWQTIIDTSYERGIALLLEPAPAFYETISDEAADHNGMRMTAIFKYLSPYKKLFVQLLVGLLLSSLLQLFVPFLTQSIVDVGINGANVHFIYIVLFAQLALFAGRLAGEFVRGWILLFISTRINLSILTDFLIKLMKLPMAFFDSKTTGDILQRMNDHRRIESFLTGSSSNPFSQDLRCLPFFPYLTSLFFQ